MGKYHSVRASPIQEFLMFLMLSVKCGQFLADSVLDAFAGLAPLFINPSSRCVGVCCDKSCVAVRFRGGDQYLSDQLTGCVSMLYHFKKVMLTFVAVA